MPDYELKEPIKNTRLKGKLLLLFFLVSATSCVPVEKLKYFNDINEITEPVNNPRGPKRILPNDKLDVRVYSLDERTNQLLNSNTGSGSGIASNIVEIGYLVDEAGNINYPFVGKIHVANLTLEEADTKLAEAITQHLAEATVSIRFVDRNVTLLGEFNSQGVFPFTKDNLTIYEAIALGGGISRFGDRRNVVLIRKEGEKFMYYRLDLSSSRIAEKEYFYVQTNDIIVVEPLKSSSWFNYNNANFGTLSATISMAVLIISLFFGSRAIL